MVDLMNSLQVNRFDAPEVKVDGFVDMVQEFQTQFDTDRYMLIVSGLEICGSKLRTLIFMHSWALVPEGCVVFEKQQ